MKRFKREGQIFVLILLILGVSLGYAMLSTNLNIEGTSKIKNASWNIRFENLSVTSGSVVIDPTDTTLQPATIDPSTPSKITYNIPFAEPGEFYEFTVDATNAGSIDAMVDAVSSKVKVGEGQEQEITMGTLPSYLNYSVTYSDGTPIEPKHKLNAGTSETYKVRVEFKRDISMEQLQAASGMELKFTFQVNYVQQDETAIDVTH